MLGASRISILVLFLGLVTVAPLAAADEIIHLITPVQGADDPDCATVGTSNYQGSAKLEHSIVGGGVWAIAYLATQDTSGSKLYLVAAPVNCLTGMDVEEILEKHRPAEEEILMSASDVLP